LLAYASDPDTGPYQPMHVNFGLFPPLDPPIRRKQERYAAYGARARADLAAMLASRPELAPVSSDILVPAREG
jgi:methylenetetrahydrofolate--tRNA-(uracil-5-)-methyltransferase